MKFKNLNLGLILIFLITCSCLSSKENYDRYITLIEFIETISDNYQNLNEILDKETKINTSVIIDKFKNEKKFRLQNDILKTHNIYNYEFDSIFEEKYPDKNELKIIISYKLSEKEFNKFNKFDETELDKNPTISEFNIYFTFSKRTDEYFFKSISVPQHFPYRMVGLNH